MQARNRATKTGPKRRAVAKAFKTLCHRIPLFGTSLSPARLVYFFLPLGPGDKKKGANEREKHKSGQSANECPRLGRFCCARWEERTLGCETQPIVLWSCDCHRTVARRLNQMEQCPRSGRVIVSPSATRTPPGPLVSSEVYDGVHPVWEAESCSIKMAWN